MRYIQIGYAINKYLDSIEKDQVDYCAVLSGYSALDGLTGGLEPGELIVIGGDPGIGKTVLALNLARNASVDYNITSVYFSLEMSTACLTRRLIAMELGMPMKKLGSIEKLKTEERSQIDNKLKILANAPLFIDDKVALSTDQLRDRVKDLVNKEKAKLIIIDYVTLLSSEPPSNIEFRRLEQQNNLRRLKEIALSFNVVVVALTHIEWRHRKKGFGPVITDLTLFYPSVEDYADKIILLHRPSLYSGNAFMNERDILEVRLVKNEKGSVGIVGLYFDCDTLKLSD